MFPRLAAILLFLLAAAPATAAEQLRILHFSDLNQMEDLPKLATALADARKAPGRVLVTHGGGLLSPSAASTLDRGAHMVALMNAIGIEMAVPGHPEFDFGPEVLAARVAESKFSWLSANIDPPVAGTVPGRILEIGSYRIGLFGLTTPRTREISSPGPDLSFGDPVAAAARSAAMLREQGADLVIALAHLATDRNFEVLRHVDLVLGGYDRQTVAHTGDDGAIVQTRPNGEQLAVVDITLDRTGGGAKFTWQPEIDFLPAENLAPDPEILAATEKYTAELLASHDRPVARTLVPLDTRRKTVFTTESAFGNLVTDIMRATLGTETALLSAGAIRGDRIYAPGDTLTERDILAELPFLNQLVTLRIPGSVLRDALENAVSRAGTEDGRFAHISGMQLTYAPGAPAGSRVKEVTVGGSPLDPDRPYTLATIDFLANGGDGYSMLSGAEMPSHAPATPTLSRLVTDELRAQGEIRATLEGRVRAAP